MAGIKDFLSSPYLIGIAGFLLLYTAVGSFAYFEQTNLLRDYDLDRRTEILALLATTVNILTFALGFFATSRLVTRMGMPATLAIMPIIMCAALLVLAFAPILTVLLALQVARQAGNYAVTRPAREMLFTAFRGTVLYPQIHGFSPCPPWLRGECFDRFYRNEKSRSCCSGFFLKYGIWNLESLLLLAPDSWLLPL